MGAFLCLFEARVGLMKGRVGVVVGLEWYTLRLAL